MYEMFKEYLSSCLELVIFAMLFRVVISLMEVMV